MRRSLRDQDKENQTRNTLRVLRSDIESARGLSGGGGDGGTLSNTVPPAITNEGIIGVSMAAARADHDHYGIPLYEASEYGGVLPNVDIEASALGRATDGLWYRRNVANNAWVLLLEGVELSNAIPAYPTTTGLAGSGTKASRDSHAHPLERFL